MTTPLTPHNLVYDLAPAVDPQISPDGTRVLYSVSRADPAASGKISSSLWLCGIDGASPRRLTWHDGRDGGARWSPDGSVVAFIAHRDSGRGVCLLPLAGGEARELTRHRKPIESLAWSPDGRHLAYSVLVDPANPDEIELPAEVAPPVRVTRRGDYKQDNRGYLGDERSQIVVVDVATGERRQITREPVDHLFPQWSPDGQTIAVRLPVDVLYSQLGLVDVATGAVQRVGPEHGVVGIWVWSPDGDRIVFAGDTSQTWQLDFFVHDLTTRETHQITDDLPCLPHAGYPTLVPPSQPVWLDPTRVLVHAIRAGASGVYLLDVATGEVTLEQSWIALHTGLSIDRAHRYVVQGHASLERTGEISVFDREAGETAIISHQNDALLRKAPPARWERFAIRRDPFEIEAWMLKPVDFDPARRYPVILDVHGGPNNYYGYGFNPLQQLLATNGFVVVYANPRGSASYGRHFTQQVTTDWGGEDYHDLVAVLDHRPRPPLPRSRPGRPLRLQLRRLYDGLGAGPNRPFPGGGLRRPLLRPRVDVRHQRHRTDLWRPAVGRPPPRVARVVRRPLTLDLCPPHPDANVDRPRRGGSSLSHWPRGTDVYRLAQRGLRR